jgi:transposase
MLGPPKPRRLDAPIAVSLDDLVPPDHFHRHLETKLGLGFVRAWARELSADRGRPGIDPVVFFKLQLIMFFEGIRSERQLVEIASLHLAHRWRLGYALDEALPGHSSLTRIRQRLGMEIFARCFEKVVDLCREASLVWGREVCFDATKVAADADVDSLTPRFASAAKHHLDRLFAGDDPTAPEADAVPGLRSKLLAGSAIPAGEGRRRRLLEERRLDPNRASDRSYDRLSECLISTTDPDATPMRTGGRTVLGYHGHDVVDGARRGPFSRRRRPRPT